MWLIFLWVTVFFPIYQSTTTTAQIACLQQVGQWDVQVCDQCMTGEQCGVHEGTPMFCCPYMKKCVPSSSHGCSSQHGPYGNCRPTCFDYNFPFDCPGCIDAFPQEWPGYSCYAGASTTSPTTMSPTTPPPTTSSPTQKTVSTTKSPTMAPTTTPVTNAPTTYVNPCLSVNCGTFGSCAIDSISAVGVCICKGGWTGTNCEVPAAATCTDGLLNQDETQVDCGGSTCTVCQTTNWVYGEWVTTCTPYCQLTRDANCVDKDGVTQADNVCSDLGLHTVKRQMNCSVNENLVACTIPTNVSNPNDYGWKYCGWDECTAACGGLVGMIGLQHRDIFCTLISTGEVVNPSLCQADTRRASVIVGCGKEQCTTYNWMSDGAWSECRDGKRSRSFHCHHKDGSNVAKTDCANIPLPESLQDCIPDACAPPTPSTDFFTSGGRSQGINNLIVVLGSLLLLLL